MYSSINLGLLPAAVIRVGEAISLGGMETMHLLAVQRPQGQHARHKQNPPGYGSPGANPVFFQACRFALRRGRRRTVRLLRLASFLTPVNETCRWRTGGG